MVENKPKKSNRIIGTLTIVVVTAIGIFVTVAAFPMATVTTTTTILQSAEAFVDPTVDRREPKAPMAASEDGNNVYVVWWTNRSGNWEVMFRASNDGGATFGDRINLSNSPDTQSQTAEILAVGNNMVFVTWWELNENVHPHTNESVLRVSTDAGQTFGPVINLGTNGTITTTATTSGNSTTNTAGGEEGEAAEQQLDTEPSSLY
jgi:hypothetical protein